METLRSLTTIFITLLIIMDPFGNLPFFLLFTGDESSRQRRKMAAIAAFAAGVILFVFALSGDYILRFFGIGLPAFQIAGGFIFFIYALQMLQLFPSGLKSTSQEEEEGVKKANVALVPLATPLLAGPGAITAVLAWHGRPDGALGTAPLVGGIALACFATYVVFYFGSRIRSAIGVGGILVVTRLMGLLLAVIAVQFMVSGIQAIGS